VITVSDEELLRPFFEGAFAPNYHLTPFMRQVRYLRGKAVSNLQGFGQMDDRWRLVVAEYGLADVVQSVDVCRPLQVVPSADEDDVWTMLYGLSTLDIMYRSKMIYRDQAIEPRRRRAVAAH